MAHRYQHQVFPLLISVQQDRNKRERKKGSINDAHITEAANTLKAYITTSLLHISKIPSQSQGFTQDLPNKVLFSYTNISHSFSYQTNHIVRWLHS